eukprot:CAMPEP_0117031622 /NCGR_PEP_ID=MMETSP0472-20121206/22708_1 /TAXON_ID=693140 ORGANISM="Tiarina fusus, Strain LIS" /NCGR_SAMPLE_ID=MMETSP0472 /ASSEMBLY_ACC=CAM_ASM_000603 /LENGTH=666 /DNA_ID=CAMNT_0004739987 /DNA_START=219 /DNA_END=2219 /DNA_ORIENTATION=+
MEDLKKQTAIRLAQEQQQQPVRLSSLADPSRDPPLRPILSDHQLHGYSRPAYPQAPPPQGVGYPNHMPYPNQQGFKVLNTYQQQPFQVASHRQQPFQQPYQQQHKPLDYQPGASRENHRNRPGNHVETQHTYPGHHQPPPIVHSGSRSPDSITFPQDQIPRYQRPAVATSHPVPRHVPPSSCEVTTVQNSNLPNAKLPHGLTVHELKEMTKARLQAEALLDRHEPERVAADSSRGSPLDFESVPEPRDRAMSRDSASRTHHTGLDQGLASDSLRSIPSLVQVNQGSRETNSGRQPRVSPLPQGFLNFASVGQALPSVDMNAQQQASVSARDSWPAQSRADTWETASSASQQSTVLSENLGSDSALSSGFGSGVNGQTDFMSGPRSRSYTYPAVPQTGARDFMFNDDKPSPSAGSPGGGNLFAPAIGANRRRACTMSPKPGSIHEDRPHFNGGDLAMPSFSNTEQSTFLIRSRKNSYSPVLSQLGLEKPGIGAGQTLIDSANRPRASSATSLPQSYLTVVGDDFPPDMASGRTQHSLGSHVDYSRARARSEDVYRDRQPLSSGKVPVPPGFDSGNGAMASSSFDYYPAFSRIEAGDRNGNGSARNGSESASSSNIFGSMGIDANDMGSILKMSGAGERPDRERSNTYPNSSHDGTDAFFTENFFGRN